RKEVRPFARHQIDVLSMFADQAVIAIENVRLFNETKEALLRQTATAEILQVISSSVSDTKPVFDTILASCERLFGGTHMGINLVGADGLVHLAAHSGPTPDRAAFERTFPVPLSHESGSGSAILDARVMHYPDTQAADVPPYVRRSSRANATRSVIIAPLLWQGRGIGALFVGRSSVGPFSDKDIALLRTFADQAVIAIQNARLFNETKDALEQQTATSEVLKTISRTTFDLQPVLTTLIESASRLCKADRGFVYLREGDLYQMKAGYRFESSGIELPAVSAESGSLVGRTALTREIVHIEDALNDPGYTWKEAQERLGYRTMLGVPMLREGEPIGVVGMWRDEVRPFSERDIRIVTTFADQAVIALENVRLLSEIQAKSRELEAANRHKSEFLANMSHELRTPLNAIIGFSEVLTEQMFGDVNDKQLEYLHDIHSSGQHLLTLINDVLDLSKIEAGRMELDLSCFDLGLLLDNSLTLVRERAQRHGLTLTLQVGDGLEEWVADARKVKQVVVNLLSNAVKFTPSGGSISLCARRVGAGDRVSAQISVADTGVGIAAEEQALVFEEFRQASGDYLRKTEGTGLGLSLARRFVELHGGAIALDSRPGAGATFTVTLPLQTLEAMAP
ncbi:MAG TPA: GAF domain-containing protein, partial [Burkholderiaceae bacterium]|nr:GAF domain-containing protein [Burkholderiaceae bacterium]